MDNAGPYGNIAHIQESSFIFDFFFFLANWFDKWENLYIYHSRGILVILDVQGYIGNFESIGSIWVILGI